MADTFVIRASWVIPVEPDGHCLTDAAVSVTDGRIDRVVQTSALTAAELAAPQIDLPRHVLLPGLVNCHGHAAMSLLRGYADDFSLARWLQERIWPIEARWVDENFVADGAALAIAEMLLSGTTCCSDMYFYPEATAAAAQRAGIRAQINFPIVRFPNAWSTDADAALHQGLQLADAHRHNPLVSIGFGPHSTYAVDTPSLSRIATLAAELGLPVQIHLHETQQEVEDSLRATGRRPFEHVTACGLLAPGLQAVHMTQLTDGEIATLAAQRVSVIHCPQSNLRLGSGICPVPRLRAAGVCVALGTDGAASNNGLDLFREMNIAALLAKGSSGDPTTLRAGSALRMATLEGARALGLETEIGSLTPGKAADIIAVDLGSPGQWPVYDPVSQLVYTGAGSQVSHVWVAGRAIVQARQLLTLDLAEVLDRAAHWSARIVGGAPAAASGSEESVLAAAGAAGGSPS